MPDTPNADSRQFIAPPLGAVHHLELWVPDFGRATASWEWLMGELGYERFQTFQNGVSWRHLVTQTYIVLEQSPAMLAIPHDRHRPGLNHLAFHAGDRATVDRLTDAAPEHGWTLRERIAPEDDSSDAYYATYLTDRDGFEVELVAH